MAMTSAAGGLISLLDEKNPRLQSLALTKLVQLVDSCWLEIADAIIRIETLHEQDSFPDRKRAALLASKVHFHLGSYEDAVQYALAADELFDVSVHNEYVDTIVSKCIDKYASLRQEAAVAKSGEQIDKRLEAVVNRMFARCFMHKQYKQALGIAIESHRLDMFQKAIEDSGDQASLLAYSVQTVLALVQNRKYRNELLHVLVKLYNGLEQPDFINMCQCLIFLDEPQSVADILLKLIEGSKNSTLTAYQIAFDLYESATQQYVSQILSKLTTMAPVPPSLAATVATSPDTPSTSAGAASAAAKPGEVATPMETDEGDKQAGKNPESDKPKPEPKEKQEKQRSRNDLSEAEKTKQDRIEKLLRILSGNEAIYLHMQFLIKNNHTDMLLLGKIKDTVRNSVGHSATVICNGLMHCGTTCDDFLRENLEWVGKATNWAKYCAVASLGVIHKGHEQEAMRLLETYLPKEGNASSTGYMEGGGLYGLGLIHANHGARVIDYLKGQLESASMENVRHGAAVGLGLAAMATHRQDIYQLLLQKLNQDDAITGEACGLAMGLVMMGSGEPTAVQDMVGYAQLTQHEKIIRGLSIGISLVMYGRREEAEPLIDNLIRDKDPILRRSAVYCIAMAHCGTGNNESIRRLLHIAVSDVNDDVKRAAVMSLGFLLFRTPQQCPTMVSLLSESYNPHVRYGAAMALGISCAGTGLREAIELLEPMLADSTNYVRQGCMIAMAMILIQQNEVTCPKVKEFREHLMKVILDKVEDTMTKFGAIIAHGILDAGGRNVSISLQSRNGQTDMESVVGVLVFSQYWYWFSLSLCLSMALKPTAIIGLNHELKMPKLQFHSAAKPSTYAYPAPLEEKKETVAEKVETAVLSITAKSKMREAAKSADKMDMGVLSSQKAMRSRKALSKKLPRLDDSKKPSSPSLLSQLSEQQSVNSRRRPKTGKVKSPPKPSSEKTAAQLERAKKKLRIRPGNVRNPDTAKKSAYHKQSRQNKVVKIAKSSHLITEFRSPEDSDSVEVKEGAGSGETASTSVTGKEEGSKDASQRTAESVEKAGRTEDKAPIGDEHEDTMRRVAMSVGIFMGDAKRVIKVRDSEQAVGKNLRDATPVEKTPSAVGALEESENGKVPLAKHTNATSPVGKSADDDKPVKRHPSIEISSEDSDLMVTSPYLLPDPRSPTSRSSPDLSTSKSDEKLGSSAGNDKPVGKVAQTPRVGKKGGTEAPEVSPGKSRGLAGKAASKIKVRKISDVKVRFHSQASAFKKVKSGAIDAKVGRRSGRVEGKGSLKPPAGQEKLVPDRGKSSETPAKVESKASTDSATKGESSKSASKEGDADKNKEKTGDKEKEEKKEKVPEPNFHMLDNPARAMRNQLRTISIPQSSRYESVKKVSIGGILILRDKEDGQPEDIVEPVKAGGTKPEEEAEVEPPEPFLFLDRDD